MNGYKVTFFRSSFMPDIHGAEDYLKVLRTLQNAVEAMEADFRAQVERAKADS